MRSPVRNLRSDHAGTPRHFGPQCLMTLALTLPLLGGYSHASTPTASNDSNVSIRTATSQITGLRHDQVSSYRGIPYAQPPVGALRWQPPLEVTPAGKIDATKFGADCSQRSPYPESLGNGNSEDCLYLNVWAPNDIKKPLPVIVFIHGGGFEYGSGALPMYDGSKLAAQGALVVTLNYRLGIFGFLAHPELDAESPRHVSGNYGILDQIMALGWIKKNIRSFGGDPGRVTLMGQSAGSRAISMLMTSPQAYDLFHQVILQSGPGLRHVTTLSEAEGASSSLGSIASLRSMSAEQLLAISEQKKAADEGLLEPVWARPVVDGWVIPRQQFESLNSGTFKAVPMLLGTNANEGGAYGAKLASKRAADFDRSLFENFADKAGPLSEVYGAGTSSDVGTAYAKLWTDMEFNVPGNWLSKASAQRQPLTFRYLFAQKRGDVDTLPIHGAELQYVFNTLDTPHKGKKPLTSASDRALSAHIQAAWVAFATTGNPGIGAAVTWPAYGQGQKCMALDTPRKVTACPDVSRVENILTTRPAGQASAAAN
jgi:para-nitrobenzyl esterase